MAMDDKNANLDTQQMTNPTDLLREDHRRVKDLFQAFEEAGDAETKESIVRNALTELKIHTMIEEEIFYPAMRQETDAADLMDEAAEEHHVAKLLIEELEGMGAEDEHFDAKFKVLAESVKHHIEEEESEMFPKAEAADLTDVGEELAERRSELKEEMEQKSSRKTGRSKRSGSARSRKSKKS